MRIPQTASKVDVLQINGEVVPVGKGQQIIISSHWNDSDLVVLNTGNNALTVRADMLIAAITRCSR